MGVAQILLDNLDLSHIVIGWYKLFGTSSLVSVPPGGGKEAKQVESSVATKIHVEGSVTDILWSIIHYARPRSNIKHCYIYIYIYVLLFTPEVATKSWIQCQAALPLYNRSFTKPSQNFRTIFVATLV